MDVMKNTVEFSNKSEQETATNLRKDSVHLAMLRILKLFTTVSEQFCI